MPEITAIKVTLAGGSQGALTTGALSGVLGRLGVPRAELVAARVVGELSGGVVSLEQLAARIAAMDGVRLPTHRLAEALGRDAADPTVAERVEHREAAMATLERGPERAVRRHILSAGFAIQDQLARINRAADARSRARDAVDLLVRHAVVTALHERADSLAMELATALELAEPVARTFAADLRAELPIVRLSKAQMKRAQGAVSELVAAHGSEQAIAEALGSIVDGGRLATKLTELYPNNPPVDNPALLEMYNYVVQAALELVANLDLLVSVGETPLYAWGPVHSPFSNDDPAGKAVTFAGATIDPAPDATNVSGGYVRSEWSSHIRSAPGKPIPDHYVRVEPNAAKTHLYTYVLHVPGLLGEALSDVMKVIRKHQSEITKIAVTALTSPVNPALALVASDAASPLIDSFLGGLFEFIGRALESRTEVVFIAHQMLWFPPTQPISVVAAFGSGGIRTLAMSRYRTATGTTLDPNDPELRKGTDDPNDDDWRNLTAPEFISGEYDDPDFDRHFRLYVGAQRPPSNPIGFSTGNSDIGVGAESVVWSAPGEGMHFIVPLMAESYGGELIGYSAAFLDEVLLVPKTSAPTTGTF